MTYFFTSNCLKEPLNTDEYFGIPIKNKKFPSCYRQNVLVMLAKRLITDDNKKNNRCTLDVKLAKRIIKD